MIEYSAVDALLISILFPKFATENIHVQGDIRIPEDLDKALSQHPCDAIISLAAEHKDFGIPEKSYFDTNERGTFNVCEAAARHGIKNIVFYSSVAVYGPVAGSSNEKTPTQPVSPYGASKLAAEKVLAEWSSADTSRSTLVLRPTVVFGERDLTNMLRLIRQIDVGRYVDIGGGENIKSIAYVENLVRATLFLMERMRPGFEIYNYADEPHMTVAEIAETIASALGRRKPLSLPFPIVHALALPFDLLIAITGKDLPVSSDRVKKICTTTKHGASKILNSGFSPIYSSREGLQRMVAWYSGEKAAGRTPVVAASSSG